AYQHGPGPRSAWLWLPSRLRRRIWGLWIWRRLWIRRLWLWSVHRRWAAVRSLRGRLLWRLAAVPRLRLSTTAIWTLHGLLGAPTLTRSVREGPPPHVGSLAYAAGWCNRRAAIRGFQETRKSGRTNEGLPGQSFPPRDLPPCWFCG